MSEHLEAYILSHIEPEPELLRNINRNAHVKLLHPRMLSGHLQGRLLKMLVQMAAAKNILEIGTYTGYSALCMAEGLTADGKIHTIEIDDEMEDFIRECIDLLPDKDKIELHIGDAVDVIPEFDDTFFDLAFIDADKRLYWKYFELLLPKIKPGGFIIADNTLWSGKVLEKPAKNDYQTKGVQEFNNKLATDPRVEKVILPIRDGLTLIRKKEQWKQTDNKK